MLVRTAGRMLLGGIGCGAGEGAPEMKNERRGIHQIAELANVSIGTVDRALHGRNGIRESTRHRILQIAAQIGYTPNLAARALSVSRTGVRIGVCIPREIRFFYDQLWSGVLDEARRQMARYYLSNSVLELAEAAYLLGYEDANSFARAFRAWEGMPPRDWREAQKAASSSGSSKPN